MSNQTFHETSISLIIIGELQSTFAHWQEKIPSYVDITYLSEKDLHSFHSDKDITFIIANFEELLPSAQSILLERHQLGKIQFLYLITDKTFENIDFNKVIYTYKSNDQRSLPMIKQNILGILSTISKQDEINIDIQDIKNILGGNSKNYFTFGFGKKNDEHSKIDKAIKMVFSTTESISQAYGIICNITTDSELSLTEYDKIIGLIYEKVRNDTTIIFGTIINTRLTDTIWIDIWYTTEER